VVSPVATPAAPDSIPESPGTPGTTPQLDTSAGYYESSLRGLDALHVETEDCGPSGCKIHNKDWFDFKLRADEVSRPWMIRRPDDPEVADRIVPVLEPMLDMPEDPEPEEAT
jgi:hypothetical protein